MKIADHHLNFLCTIAFIIFSFWLGRNPTTDSTVMMLRIINNDILIFLAVLSFINWLIDLKRKKDE